MAESIIKPVQMAVLLSGSGRTLQNFIDLIKAGQLPARIVHVISSRQDAFGLQRATQAGIKTSVVRQSGKLPETFSQEINDLLDANEPDLLCMAGFLSLWLIPEKYRWRVMNIHPALLPAFGGKGMYGQRVHKAVLDAGCKISGCTVHFADNNYDRGPIIIQRAVRVIQSDDPDSLAQRVFQQELIAYPEAIRLFAAKALRVVDGRVQISPEMTKNTL